MTKKTKSSERETFDFIKACRMIKPKKSLTKVYSIWQYGELISQMFTTKEKANAFIKEYDLKSPEIEEHKVF